MIKKEVTCLVFILAMIYFTGFIFSQSFSDEEMGKLLQRSESNLEQPSDKEMGDFLQNSKLNNSEKEVDKEMGDFLQGSESDFKNIFNKQFFQNDYFVLGVVVVLLVLIIFIIFIIILMRRRRV